MDIHSNFTLVVSRKRFKPTILTVILSAYVYCATNVANVNCALSSKAKTFLIWRFTIVKLYCAKDVACKLS